jgi:hypothetical protein
MSLAGMTTSRLAAGFGALFAFVFPDPCAKTATGNANVITSVRTFLVLTEASVLVNSVAARRTLSRETREG